jgi:glyoxylase-like metal-dependent hydrolase (beta-lactamase superfamily II)
MTSWICTTCGTQYESAVKPPRGCRICEDERQFVNWNGQEWTTLKQLQGSHSNVVKAQGPGITGVGTIPKFAIGQRALLVQTTQGNLLWDCISLIDEATTEAARALGGISAIAISHPHYYSSMVEWSEKFGNVPIYLHADDRQWVMRPSRNIVLWEGEAQKLFDGLTLIRCGGHFEGGTVLHWGNGEKGAGALLTGDIIQVAQDRRYVSFMWSYPNYIPLSAAAVNRITRAVEPLTFKRIYGAWWEAIVESDGKAAVEKSATRYLKAIGQTENDIESKRLLKNEQRRHRVDEPERPVQHHHPRDPTA